MTRRIPSCSRTSQRPCHQAYLIDMPARPNVVHDGVDVIPIGSDGGQLMRIARDAWGGEKSRNKGLLLLLGEIAWIVHRSRPSRAPVPRHVHREDIKTGTSQIRHPAVILMRN